VDLPHPLQRIGQFGKSLEILVRTRGFVQLFAEAVLLIDQILEGFALSL
jgi:hypothetical protein